MLVGADAEVLQGGWVAGSTMLRGWGGGGQGVPSNGRCTISHDSVVYKAESSSLTCTLN